MKSANILIPAVKLFLIFMLTASAQVRPRTVTKPEKTSPVEPAQVKPESSEKNVLSGLTRRQKLTAEQMTSFFENLTLEFQYASAEKLNDGRGFTVGRIGFTTGTSDALMVVRKYTELVPQNPLAKYLPELERLDDAEDKDETQNLELFEEAWKTAAKDKIFRKIQDEFNDHLYFNPSQQLANECGLKYALSRAALYDACVQHGYEGTPDSLSSMLVKTNTLMNGSPKDGIDETLWLANFLKIRTAVLLDPDDKDSKDEWADSVERVSVFTQLLEKKNYQLKLPLRITCFDESVTIYDK
jgi:chitosanase